jgi:hypothetical protein
LDISTYNQEQKSRKEEDGMVQERRHDEFLSRSEEQHKRSVNRVGSPGEEKRALDSLHLFWRRSCCFMPAPVMKLVDIPSWGMRLGFVLRAAIYQN